MFLYFVQTALLIAGPAATTPALSWLNIAAVNPQDPGSAGLCLGPITPIGKLGLALAMPFVYLAELFLTVLIHFLLTSALGLGSDKAFSCAAYSRTLLALLLYSYTSLTTSTISFLNCVDFGSARVVALFPAIDCRSAAYQHLLPLVLLILALTLAFPVALALLFLVRRKDIQADAADQRLHAWSNLFESFKPTSFFWTVVVLVRRTLYVACTTVIDVGNRGLGFVCLTVLCTLMQYRAKPFVDKFSNRIEILSLGLHTLISAVLIRYPNSNDSHLSVAFPILITLPSVLFLVYVIVVFVLKIRAPHAETRRTVASNTPRESMCAFVFCVRR